MNHFGKKRWFVHIEAAHAHKPINNMQLNHFHHDFFFFFFYIGVKGLKAGHKSVVNDAHKWCVFADARVSVLGECSGGFSPFSLG